MDHKDDNRSGKLFLFLIMNDKPGQSRSGAEPRKGQEEPPTAINSKSNNHGGFLLLRTITLTLTLGLSLSLSLFPYSHFPSFSR